MLGILPYFSGNVDACLGAVENSVIYLVMLPKTISGIDSEIRLRMSRSRSNMTHRHNSLNSIKTLVFPERMINGSDTDPSE